MHTLEVVTGGKTPSDYETAEVKFGRDDDGTWWIIPPGQNERSDFAQDIANKRDVEQLIRHEYDDRY